MRGVPQRSSFQPKISILPVQEMLVASGSHSPAYQPNRAALPPTYPWLVPGLIRLIRDTRAWTSCLSLIHLWGAISVLEISVGLAEACVTTTVLFNFSLCPVPLPSLSHRYCSQGCCLTPSFTRVPKSVSWGIRSLTELSFSCHFSCNSHECAFLFLMHAYESSYT